jgi:hypothetical protein
MNLASPLLQGQRRKAWFARGLTAGRLEPGPEREGTPAASRPVGLNAGPSVRDARGLTAGRLERRPEREGTPAASRPVGLNTTRCSEGLPVPGSRAVGASAARRAKRRGHAVRRGREGRGERPGDGAWAAPSGAPREVPIAYAIGLPGARGARRTRFTSLTRLGFLSVERQNTHSPRPHGRSARTRRDQRAAACDGGPMTTDGSARSTGS